MALGRNIDRIERNIESIESKFAKIFKRPKNREDGSDFDDFWTESIVSTQSIFSKIFERTKNYRIDRIDRFDRSIDRSYRSMAALVVNVTSFVITKIVCYRRVLAEGLTKRAPHTLESQPPATWGEEYYAVKKFLRKYSRSVSKFSRGFSKFSRVFRGFRLCSDTFGSIWTHWDAFGRIRTHSDAFGSNWKHLDTFKKILHFLDFWVVFQRFWTYFLVKTFLKLFSRHNHAVDSAA